MDLLEVKPHSHSKYRILSKYLGACKFFSQKYENFVYVETHGGTGRIYDSEKKKQNNGSVLRAAKIEPKFPCYVVEIDDENYKLLGDSIQSLSNVTPFHGDCNEEIDIILDKIPRRKKFVLFFVDPDSLKYDDKHDQLKWKTVEKIAKFPRSEILLNFPLLAITRCASVYQDYPEAFSSKKMTNRITRFYGTEKWMDLEANDRRSLLELYLSERLVSYDYKGATLIRNPNRGPLYYLVYGSKYQKGGEIMRDIMKKEWVENIVNQEPLSKYFYKTDKEWLDAEYPLTHFIFED